jgi:hypothetical protein
MRVLLRSGLLPDTPAALRAEVLRQVNVERQRRLDRLTVTVAGVTYDADPVGKGNLVDLLTAAVNGVPFPWPLDWRCTDNAVRPLDYATAVQLAAAIMVAIQSIYAASWRLKDETVPALSDAELAGFDVTAADLWPAA